MELDEIWRKALVILEARLSRPSFEALVKPAQPITLEDNLLVVHTPNDFSRDWLSTKYVNDITEAVCAAAGTPIRVTFITDGNMNAPADDSNIAEPDPADAEPRVAAVGRLNNLNPKYTFGSFVVGNHSRFAHAAAMRVAEAPATAYNPLFIYGGVGLGKTHLMHAIGQSLLQHKPTAKIVYLSSERFTNDMIASIREQKQAEFRNRYRSVDLLLIDDIQFIEGKEGTQEEFFHTFNALHEAGKQFVISSDRPPKDIPELEARLRSRFEWGLVTDIQPPDLETRMAILQKKAALDGLQVGNDVLEYIANQHRNNVRELEGAFIRVMAYASLTNAAVTVGLAQQTLGAQFIKEITLDTIKQLVSDHFRIEMAELLSTGRQRDMTWARQVGMYLARELTSSSLPKVGDAFGGRDHTTVMHAYEKVKKIVAANPEVKREVDELIRKLH
ncbi:MAG: chromosomal replication initiator protein DnaA [Candidatus Sericytochromatia bacterium]|nr:chromosomal replication initiator protein DnaA [Candidatus Sericytochromatia bacterium]